MKYDNPDDIWVGITTCAAHTHMDEDCEYCVAELKDRGERIDELAKESTTRISGIIQQGGSPPDRAFLLEVRLEVLLDSVLIDHKNRVKYEGEVGRRIMQTIKSVQEQIKQPALIGTNGQRLRAVKDTPQA